MMMGDATRPMRVLITGAGTATAISVLKALRRQNEIPVDIVVADAQKEVAGRYLADAFVQVPTAGDPDYLSTMVEVCDLKGIDLLIPIVDPEFLPLSHAAQELLDRGTRVAISGPKAIDICGDKLLLARFLASLGLPVARCYDGVEAVPVDAQFPLFVKPRLGGRASIGTCKVADAKELEIAAGNLESALVQEYVEGDEYTIDTISDFEGRFIGAMPRIRLETKAGVSVKGITVDDPELIEVARLVTEALPILGPSNIQCFRRPDRSLVVSEVNPRFAGALTLSVAAGLNSPLVLLKLARGEAVDPGQLSLRHGVIMVRYWQEVFVYGEGEVDAEPWPRNQPASAEPEVTAAGARLGDNGRP